MASSFFWNGHYFASQALGRLFKDVVPDLLRHQGMSTAILIDGAYLDAICKWDLQGQRIDFAALIEQMAGGDLVAIKTYYHCPVWLSEPPTQEERRRQAAQRAFFAVLTRRFGLAVKLGKTTRTVTPAGDVIYGQRKVDVMLAVDLTAAALTDRATRISLLCGNADLTGAVRVARLAGVRTTLWHREHENCLAGAMLKAQASELRLVAAYLTY